MLLTAVMSETTSIFPHLRLSRMSVLVSSVISSKRDEMNFERKSIFIRFDSESYDTLPHHGDTMDWK